MKLGLGIIAKNYDEVTDKIKDYYKFFDNVIVAVDSGYETDYTAVYEWSEEEKSSKMLDFARKRNFLHNKMIEDGCDYYFTIDTDDIVAGLEDIRKLADKADEQQTDIVYLPYHYSKDEFGNVNAIHNKERLIRCTNNIYWNMPIHENIIPVEGYQQSIMISDFIVVVHDIDFEHAEHSYDRNIQYMIKEWNEKREKTDPRTIAYLGRCFAAKKHLKEALFFLTKHVDMSGWDEDKCMSLCQIADIYRELKDYDAALKCAHNALIMRDDYPEPYLKLHDIYVELNKFDRAIYWGELGSKIKRPQTFMIVDPSYTGWRLDLSLSFCYMQLGKIERAFELFLKAKKQAPDLDFIKNNDKWYRTAYEEYKFLDKFVYLLTELEMKQPEKIKHLVKAIPDSMANNTMVTKIRNRYEEPKVWEDNSIAIICGYTFDEWSPKSLETGIGGSEEAVIQLSKELVKVGYKVTVYNGCGDDEGIYDGVEYKEFTRLNPRDNFNIIIGWRSNIFSMHDFKAHYKYVWLHDVYRKGSCADHSRYDAVIVLSQFHKSLLTDDIPEEKIIVSANGINIAPTNDVERNKNKIIYASSYDRGLEHLLERWPEVQEQCPEAELHIYYGWNNIDKLIHEDGYTYLAKFKEKMTALMQQDGVFHHGRVGNKELHETFKSSYVWAYPSSFNEISCITAMKAQELGCIPVITDHAALKETVKNGVIVAGNASDSNVMNAYIQMLVSTLKGDVQYTKADYDFGWNKVAEQWKEEFSKRSFKPHQYDSLEQYKEVYSNMSEDNVTLIDKDITTSRYNFVLETVMENDCESMLDVGCFDGSLPVYAARAGINTTGIDINTTFIEVGKKVAPENCTLIGGTAFEEFEPNTTYDCVSATEVIEHVMDTDAFFKKAHSLLNDGGIMVVSTPHKLGRYGITNHDVHHIRHYDDETLKADMSKYFDVKYVGVDAELLNCYGVKK